jgi:hypothetical protein
MSIRFLSPNLPNIFYFRCPVSNVAPLAPTFLYALRTIPKFHFCIVFARHSFSSAAVADAMAEPIGESVKCKAAPKPVDEECEEWDVL